MFVKSMVGAASALLLATAASAASVDITEAVGALDNASPLGYSSDAFAYLNGQTFVDDFSFSLSTTSRIYLDIASITSARKGLQFTQILLRPDIATLTPATGGPLSFDFGALQPGFYLLTVAGVGSGVAGGSYHLDLYAQAVPEPQSIALMLAGVGVVGAAARRRAR